ncbi:gamma-glutamyltransferase [Litorivivens sp.]|uniref:gamma-glutamyltransferase n=1 Tax=Litorivivens sp. TaxID=2020868 RepID=UPI0035636749
MRILLIAITSLLLACSAKLPDNTAEPKTDIVPEAASGFSGVTQATASEFMAVTANPYATNAARDILAKGGSAVDAAIAAQLVLGLVEPQSSGIGGGAFALHWDAEQQTLSAWDGRETAPAALGDEHFLKDGKAMSFFEAVIGGHSVGTPGVIALLESLHQRHGKLPWKTLFQPAIALADSGFVISPRLHTLLEKMPKVAVNPAITAYFFEADGKTPKAAGTRLRNPDYAGSLRLIARQGSEAFYRGKLAKAMVAAVQNDPNHTGLLSEQDLADYRAIERQAVCSPFRQYRICGMPPPSSGGTTVGAILGTLQHVTSRSDSQAQQWHHFAEASRLAFADRNHYIADPDFVAVPTQGLVEAAYLKQRSNLIQPGARMRDAPVGKPPGAGNTRLVSSHSPELPSTTHLSIVDAQGNIVSMTSSIETAFGSRVFVGGFLLNNQLTDFSFEPENARGLIANRPQGGKRPRSSMAPTIVFEQQQPRLVIGSPGGSRIINYVARSIWDILENRQPVAEAVAAPHVIAMGRGIELEKGRINPSIPGKLEALGHSVRLRDQTSGLHAIWIGDKGLEGGADPRREGTISGR